MAALLQPPDVGANDVEQPTREINRLLAMEWKTHKIRPSEPAGDLEFLRRASLDIIGRIATVEEVREFDKDARLDKRTRLVDRLLGGDEYARYWASFWTDLLLTPSYPVSYRILEKRHSESGEVHQVRERPDLVAREQLRTWLETQFARNRSYQEMVEELLTAVGKTNENGAVHFVLAHLGNPIRQPKSWVLEGQFDFVPLTVKALRLFLGKRVEGVAHLQPARDPSFRLRDFWGVNAFFRQVEVQHGTARRAPAELRDNPGFNTNPDGGPIIVYDTPSRAMMATGPVFLGRIPMARDDKRPRRQVLARLLTRHENFSRVFVNRLWGHFFGKGLDGEFAVDDFGDHNGKVHPIRDRLAQEFTTVGRYDIKKLIRWICTSHVYQLQSTANDTNAEEHTDWLFSRMLLKPLSPDQLLESLLVATGPQSGRDPKTRQKLWEQGLEPLLEDMTEEDREEGWFRSVVPALWLMNDPIINGAIARRNSGARVSARDPNQPLQTAEELYLATVNRYPAPKEVRRIEQEIDKIRKGVSEDLSPLWQDLQWALLNSNEFSLNH
jgi:hypothetical protein